jgi:2-keto-4-pentenoate hydratase/2-oxohepta-3-ene-1,7-dioic acid hydratase in catechol pathway
MLRCYQVNGAAAVAAAPTLEPSSTPFTLGTFDFAEPQAGTRTSAGVVIEESTVIDLAAAAVELGFEVPVEMKALIAAYDAGARDRIREVIGHVEAAGSGWPAFVHDLAAVTTRPPIMYPTTLLNTAVNYAEHDVVIGPTATRVPVASAMDHVFGYTLQNDVSGRAGRRRSSSAPATRPAVPTKAWARW